MSDLRTVRAAGAVIVLGLLALGRPRPVNASPGEGRAALVQLTIAAPDPVVDAIATRLGARLGQRGAILKVQVVPRVSPNEALNAAALSDPDAALARVWLDAGGPDEVALFLVPPAADRVLARKLALPSGVDEVALAEIVFIVDGATQALQAARPIGVPREEARAALQVAAVPAAGQPAARPSRLTFQLGVMGGARSWSGNDTAVPEAALYLLAERRGKGGRVGVAFDGALRRDVQTDTLDARLTTAMTAFHLWLTLAKPFAGAGVGRVMIGPSLSVAEVAPELRTDAARVVISKETRTDLEWAVSALLRWELTLADRMVVFVAAGADFVPAPTRYTAEVDRKTAVLLSTWPVRPTALIGAAIDLPAL